MQSILVKPKASNWVVNEVPKLDQSSATQGDSAISVLTIVGVPLIEAILFCLRKKINFLVLSLKSTPSMETASCKLEILVELSISSESPSVYVIYRLLSMF
jgi:hypothetical protein